MSRTELITDRLELHWATMPGVAVSTPPAEGWWAHIGPAAIEDPDEYSNARFGWSWPVPNEDPALDAGLIAPFCPEIIDQQTAHLDDHDFDTYLNAIVWMCDMFIAYTYETPDIHQRATRVENELFDTAHGSIATLSEVQLRVLDTAASH